MQNMKTQDKMNDQERMGYQLKQFRKDYGFKSQEKLAEFLGLSKDTIYNYENGKTAIPHDIIKRLCKEFNVSADYFFFGYDSTLNKDEEMNDIDAILSEKISKCSKFEKKQVLDMMEIMFRECPAV